MEYVDVAMIGGGQSGLTAARALLRHGLRPVALEAFGGTAGSWPRHSCPVQLSAGHAVSRHAP
ncbi:NAD(P)-binding protein [Streptomyces sp. NPDC058463]|uniref:NAD(P)-binding protein n=1 Tax=Streptomyces sp. NPDC058463 TaxID=3346510 RepID=UPI00364A759F